MPCYIKRWTRQERCSQSACKEGEEKKKVIKQAFPSYIKSQKRIKKSQSSSPTGKPSYSYIIGEACVFIDWIIVNNTNSHGWIKSSQSKVLLNDESLRITKTCIIKYPSNSVHTSVNIMKIRWAELLRLNFPSTKHSLIPFVLVDNKLICAW